MISLSDFTNESCFPKKEVVKAVEIEYDDRISYDKIIVEKQIIENKTSVDNTILTKIDESKNKLENEVTESETTESRIIPKKKAPLAIQEDFISVITNFQQEDNDKISSTGKESDHGGYVLSKIQNVEFGIRWSMLSDVINSGIKPIVSRQEKLLQESMFEVISSEAKYYTGLKIVIDHYYNSYLFSPINDKFGYVNPIDKHHIFSNLIEVMKTSEKLLHDFEMRWKHDRPFLHDVCDILYEHASSPDFNQYVIYIKNQSYQQEAYNKLMESTNIKKEMLRLQESTCSRGLSLDSYLLLPMQRLTRYKLLVKNILTTIMHEDINKNVYKNQIENANKAIDQISHLLSVSESGKIDLDNKALLMDLLNKIDFPVDCKMLSFNGKILLKEGEYKIDECHQKHGSKITKRSTFLLLLFNDLMMIGKRIGSRIQILDYCARKDVVFTIHVMQMIQERKNKKNIYYITDEDEKDSLKFYLKFSSSCNCFLREPIILKVKNREELDSWLNYLPDCNNREIYDYNRPSNIIYWSSVKTINHFINI